ncbi:iron complex outermembrane recepter protein [Methylocaldum szegediense]|uniref:Iron complex outermembrane recepter protein n=1 Tax=Methylocaldum szegediense TaxID=73780 RepID=A0ABN8X2V1_9GAMM|nr:TonB-dependent receptor [Methylocaldum szegediense]CAI8842036.1 iron complex outermembrane recepter protein [Methylocaldum szegediense]
MKNKTLIQSLLGEKAMKRWWIVPAGLGCLPVWAEPAPIGEPPVLDVVTVEGVQTDADYVEPKGSQPNTESTVSREGIRRLAGPGQTNVFKALDLLPSLHTETADPFGLTANRAIRIRGKGAFHLGQTIEGLPLTGVVGGADIYDLENMDGITLYRGAVPPDKGFGFSNATGLIDQTILRPFDKPGFSVRESFGSYGFNRVYGRIDSGLLPTDTKLFASYSYTTAYKWRGAGESPANRHNLGFGFTQKLTDSAKLEIFGAYNDLESHDFRPLNYSQATRLDAFGKFDYNRRLSGIPGQDINYYDFNRREFSDFSLFANLEIKLTDTSRISVKPYYWRDDGFRLFASNNLLGSPGVTRWDIEHEQVGLVAQYDTSLQGVQVTLGYWWQDMESPPPPVGQKAYRVTASGDLAFAGWSVLSKQENHVFHSPYLVVNGQLGKANLRAGVRYLDQTVPGIRYYDTQGLPDVDYDNVFRFNPREDPTRRVASQSFQEWLPHFGVNYEITDEARAYFTYGRNYGRPDWGPQASLFNASRARFTAAGLNLDNLFRRLKPEISDNFDLGLRIGDGNWWVAPTLFYAIVNRKEVNLYDPAIQLTYYQSNAEARSYGAEIEAGITLWDDLSLFSSVSYNRYEFENDVRTAANTVIATKGKQVPDSPEVTAKVGLTYRFMGFAISPTVRYVGERFGDAENTQRVPSYTVADLYIDYEKKDLLGLGDITLGLSFLNVFDKRYIGIISQNDIQVAGNTTYYPGAPFTVAFTVGARF